MIERIPEDRPELPETPERRAARKAFLKNYYDAIRWQHEDAQGEGRSALVLLAEAILGSLEAAPLEHLTSHLRHFLDNEAARRDFCTSLGVDWATGWTDDVLQDR